jgi:radical SAM superfamily enzyme YgiQ (UPF0313 family)
MKNHHRVSLIGTSIKNYPCGSYNLALPYISAYASKYNPDTDIRIFDFPICTERPELPYNAADLVLSYDPDVIGFSCYCWDRDLFLSFIPEIKKKSPDVKIILGGPSVMFDSGQILEKNSYVDIIVTGEGEQTFSEILGRNFNSLSEISGIAYRDGSSIQINKPRNPEVNLINIPSPYLSNCVKPPAHEMLIEYSRGCMFRCRYCAWQSYSKGIRYADLKIFEQEIRWASDHDMNSGILLSSALNYDCERLRNVSNIISMIRSRMTFQMDIHHEFFTEEQIDLFARMNPSVLEIGLESINPAALKNAGRPPVDRDRIQKVIEALSSIIPVQVTIMLGIPGDTLDGFIKTIDFLESIAFSRTGKRQISEVLVFLMIITEGSFFSKHRDKYGIQTKGKGIPYLTGCNSFPHNDIEKAIRILRESKDQKIFKWAEPSFS